MRAQFNDSIPIAESQPIVRRFIVQTQYKCKTKTFRGDHTFICGFVTFPETCGNDLNKRKRKTNTSTNRIAHF